MRFVLGAGLLAVALLTGNPPHPRGAPHPWVDRTTEAWEVVANSAIARALR